MSKSSKNFMSRRAIITALGAGLITRPLGAFAAPAVSNPDVLVIGAGLSGLYTALLLEELGATVQVIESRSRVGGRLHTLYDLPGHPEVGGNTIASGYGRTINMARRTGVKLVDYAPRMYGSPPPELVLNGAVVSPSEWTNSPQNPFAEGFKDKLPWQLISARTAQANPLPTATDWLDKKYAALDVPLHQYLKAQGLSDGEIRLAYDAGPYYGTSAWDVSALMYLFNERWIQEQISIGPAAYAVKGGNQRLPEAMAATLKGEIRLDCNVASIKDDGKQVTVRCENGESFVAPLAVCSTPFSKVRDLNISPALQGVQREAVSTLPYMRNTLIFLVPKRPFWEADKLSPTMWTNGILGTVMAQRFGNDPDEVTGLVVNARGWRADRLDRLGPAAAQAAAISEIERLRPAAKGALEAGGFHSWWLDPHNAGDWAIFGPGQVSGLIPEMSLPHGRLHFCGEHTATMNRGMEAAMESAERVAIEVLERL